MPNIPQFDLPSSQSKLTPQEGGAMTTMRAARVTQETSQNIGASVAAGWRNVGNAVTQAGHIADDYLTQKDISSAAEAHTRLAAQAATDLPGILANSPDPVKAVKDYYDNTMQPAIEKINGQMITKRSRMWASEHSESGAQNFMRSGLAEAMSITGARAIQSFQSSVDNLAVAAKADPHNLDGFVKQADSLMDGMKGTLTGQQQITMEMHRQTVKQQLAVSAGHSLADQNPEQFKKDLAAGWGQDYLNPQQRELMGHYADYALKHKKMADARNSSNGVLDWATGNQVDPKTAAPMQFTPQGIGAIQNDPNVSADDKEAAVRFGVLGNQVWSWKRQNFNTRHPAPHGNMGDEYMLEQGIKNGTTKIGDIADQMQEYLKTKGQRGISEVTAHSLMNKLKPEKIEKYGPVHADPVLKSTREQAEEYIKGSTSHIVAAGDTSFGTNPAYQQKIRQFRMDVDRTLEAAVDNKENYKDYLDPKNPKYLFSDEKLRQYVPSQRELADQVVARPMDTSKSPFLNAKPLPDGQVAPRRSLDEIMKGMGGPAKR
jgi:hypothetical protein